MAASKLSSTVIEPDGSYPSHRRLASNCRTSGPSVDAVESVRQAGNTPASTTTGWLSTVYRTSPRLTAAPVWIVEVTVSVARSLDALPVAPGAAPPPAVTPGKPPVPPPSSEPAVTVGEVVSVWSQGSVTLIGGPAVVVVASLRPEVAVTAVVVGVRSTGSAVRVAVKVAVPASVVVGAGGVPAPGHSAAGARVAARVCVRMPAGAEAPVPAAPTFTGAALLAGVLATLTCPSMRCNTTVAVDNTTEPSRCPSC